MRPNIANTDNKTNRFLARLTAERKKTVLAFCLIAVMSLMWVRVLSRKAPDTASASLMIQQENLNDQPPIESGVKISFVELPKVAGRNDVIVRDFFDSNKWLSFIKDEENLAGYEVDVPSNDDSKEVIVKIAEKLKLEAIELGENPCASINGRLLSVGDKFRLRDGLDSYECEVVQIEQNLVRLVCSEVEITLRLTPMVEVFDQE